MKKITTILAILFAASAAATDYSVGIVPSSANGFPLGGSAINLYASSASGVQLVSTYVLNQKDFTGNLAAVLFVAINPSHTFVYVAYTGPVNSGSNGDGPMPIIVGLKITSKGLEYQWQRTFYTYDPELAGATLTAGPDYVIENSFPDSDVFEERIVNESGKQVFYNYGGYTEYLVSGHVDPVEGLYYSCRATSQSSSATEVYVYKLPWVKTYSETPVDVSTDPIYVQGICSPHSS